jgi:hypothetical protein
MLSLNISEIRTDHIDDDNLQHIDCYFSEDDNAEGTTVAVVDLDTGKVIFFDNRYRGNPRVKEAISKVSLARQLPALKKHEREALDAAISAIYFNDNADYLRALFTVCNHLLWENIDFTIDTEAKVNQIFKFLNEDGDS